MTHQTAGRTCCRPLRGKKNNWEEAVSSPDSCELVIVSGLVNGDLKEVNLSTTTSSTRVDSLGIEVLLVHLVNFLSLTVLPGRIPYAFHVVMQSSTNLMFNTLLTPSNLTLAEVLWFTISHSVTSGADMCRFLGELLTSC